MASDVGDRGVRAAHQGSCAGRASVDWRTLAALALVGPLLVTIVVVGAARALEQQRRNAAAARDLGALFGAAYGVLQAAEAAQRDMTAALAARDTGLRFVPDYQAAEIALRTDLETTARLAPLVPESAAAAREVARPFDDASSAAARVIQALRRHDLEEVVSAGYEVQAALALTRDAAQSLVDGIHAALPRRLEGRAPSGAIEPLWAGALAGALVALVLWGALVWPLVRSGDGRRRPAAARLS